MVLSPSATPRAVRPTAVPPPQVSRASTGPFPPVRHTVAVDGIRFDALREDQVVAHVMDCLERGTGGSLITPNVDILRQLRVPANRELVESADLVVPDGMPIVWASRLLGRPLPERVTGSSLIWSLARAAAVHQRRIHLFGGAEGIAERAAARLGAEVDGLGAVGWRCPPFGFDDDPERLEAELRTVVDAAPDVVFVGLGFPRQENVMRLLRQRLPRTWFVGCGGGLTMTAGEVSRAPAWVQRTGLEWVHRLVQEPRRMAKRYLVHDLPYAARLMAVSGLRRTAS